MRVLASVVALLAAAMVAAAALAVTRGLSQPAFAALAGVEIVVMAILVLPWFTIYARRAADRFSPGDAAERTWRVLSIASVLLILGQFGSYVPAALDLGEAEPYVLIAGQLLPAIFRMVLLWALWRMRRAYRGTGIDFRLTALDYAASAAVAALGLTLIVRRDVMFSYLTVGTEAAGAVATAITAVQVLNYVLYPAVFYESLAMSRYAVQMGGGLVSRAWFGVAVYGLLQPLHAFTIAMLWPVYGPLTAVALDNFVVLAAFASLAYGPMFQVEATEVSRS